MTRPIRATIDRAALRHNFATARRHAGAARLWCVVKANAYGHGLERAVAALADLTDGFALIELERAVRLRAAGFELPILMLEGFYTAEELPLFIEHRLIPVLHRLDQIHTLLAANWPAALPVYLKLDTGMHRLGFDAAGLAAARTALSGKVPDITLMTHFADADGSRGVDWQLERFATMTAGMDLPCSLSNSAALLRFPDVVANDWARPGIMLYGGSPFPQLISAAELDLQPVMTLQSEIIAVQTLVAGDSVGYGCSFTSDHPMRIGVVACGYADGYPRHAPTGTPVLVDGLRTRTLGRVSMDKLCVDLTDLPAKVGAGGTATLWGQAGETVLPADEVATSAGTISYELFCALAARVPVSEIN
ncbi:MAG: alanine racemase [Gammaproteobacteria bacterium]|nr:alanine racemase [Rhodocyclaceae bacterium]MBU3909930.1 alanine racemase [Gammaproteobacteria bacterium]MBU3988059.1 alanine racemase [Gammaproteobacteria bacterium]MBU4003491.1 alanine racemase [Gammaproteobacteria bacterium]MBU4020150.1 alanine racemase [Gammaproteobacteria bacterium]